MTREEEIRLTADKYCLDEYTRLGFVAGARWADANPNKDNMATAYKVGEAATIDKACSWLLEWETHQREDIEVVEQFREAMESGCSEIPNNCEKGE